MGAFEYIDWKGDTIHYVSVNSDNSPFIVQNLESQQIQLVL